MNGSPSWNVTPFCRLTTHLVKVVFGYQSVASQGLAPLSAPTVASGSSTVEPSRLPVSAHWAVVGFQPLVSARTPTTSVPPE